MRPDDAARVEDVDTRRAVEVVKAKMKIIDDGVEAARARWVRRVTDAVASGAVDGAFIDGNRGGWGAGIIGAADQATQAAWRSQT